METLETKETDTRMIKNKKKYIEKPETKETDTRMIKIINVRLK